jgi:hypothetical protein
MSKQDKPGTGAAGKHPVARGVVKAATSAINLTVMGAAGVGAAALGSWPIAALGGVAYGALVAWDLASPKFWAKVRGQPSAPPPVDLPAADKLATPALRRLCGELLEARAALARVRAAAPPEVLGHVAETLASVGELEQRAAVLLRRGDLLARYLASAGLEKVRAAVEDLRRKREATLDAEARAQYESALVAKQEHLRTLEELAAASDRIAAHLTRLTALLDALPAKIVHLEALDAQAMDRVSGALNDEIESFTLEISSFEETLKTMAEVPSS